MTIDKSGKWVGPTRSEQFAQNRSQVQIPQISPSAANNVSQYRKEMLSREVQAGLFKDGSGTISKENVATDNSAVLIGGGISKMAQAISGGASGHFRGTGDTVKQTPEVYSPLWLTSNLNLPRDRATINSWCRSFFALNPFVSNAIHLHSTYPISKLNIKSPNKKAETFFNNMIEEIDLLNILVGIAQEYFLLGEAFVYAELDESKGKWQRLVLQNPDYMLVKRTVIANEPVIMIRPDENLKKIVMSNKKSDIEQRKQLNPHVVDSVRRGENIMLNNFNVSHLARRISPYEIRGTGLPVSIFRQLMLFDQLRECYDQETEVLTDQGFKKIFDLIENTTKIDINSNYVNGISLDENNQISSILTMKDGFKVACYNPNSKEMEYHKPIELHVSQYEGKMMHFIGKKVDCLVTPNHKMWTKEKIGKNWKEYEKRAATDLTKIKRWYKFLSKSKFIPTKEIEFVNVIGKQIPVELYLKILGYLVSEGCVYSNFENGRYDAFINVCQYVTSDCYEDMKESFNLFAQKLNKNCRSYINEDTSEFANKSNINFKWGGSISGKELVKYFTEEIGTNGNTYSEFKRLPRWVMDIKPELMKILLDALVKGDGTESISKYGTNSKGYKYSTISKQLADDVYELAYKIGYVPNICISDRDIDSRHVKEYIVLWSDTKYGEEPNISSLKKVGNNGGGARIKEVDYNGIVWCFEVPTGLFITRRNGKITIQGNSKFAQAASMVNPLTIVKVGTDGPDGLKPTFADLEAYRSVFEQLQYDKDAKIFTHPGVTVERIGYGQGIYDISGDITQLVKEIYVGLEVPSVVVEGGDSTTYANGGVALDVMRQRYMTFRNMLSTWLKRKIFAPISKIQGFYDYVDGEKQLVVPEIDWNHMSLFDTGDYIQNLVALTAGEPSQRRISLHSLYRSLGMEQAEEDRKIRKEAIQSAILKKEQEALDKMSLSELRILNEDSEIKDKEPEDGEGKSSTKEAPLPGESLPGLEAEPPTSPGSMPPPPV